MGRRKKIIEGKSLQESIDIDNGHHFNQAITVLNKNPKEFAKQYDALVKVGWKLVQIKGNAYCFERA